MSRVVRLLVRLTRRRRRAQCPARVLESEMELGVVQPTARRRAELVRLRQR